MAEYVVAMVVYVAAFLVALLFGWQICRSIVWQPGDPLYRMLTWARDNAPLVVAAGLLAGWLVVTYLFLRRPLKYLDDVVDAAQRLAARSDTAVSLPPAMREIESQLNLVREQSMRAGLEAREAERRKNDLLVYLAHDLKTPLTSVIGYLNLLNDEPDLSPALRARYAGIALDKALRLEDLLNEFFEITRFNLSRIELETREVDLTRMLEQVADEFAPALAEKGMRCELRLPPRTPYVCDPDKLARVFDNLLRNACNYGDPGTAVEVDGAADEFGVALTFVNFGRTIPPEKLERLFDRFYRLDSARGTGAGGAGLGLAIAREIVEAHGGAIAAESADGRVIFRVRLPARPRAPRAEAALPAEAE